MPTWGRLKDKFKLQVPNLKTKLSEKFKLYNREKSKVELAISKFNNVPEETLWMSLSVKLINAVLIKETLKDAFEEVNDAVNKLKSVVMKAKVDFDYELWTIEVIVDQNFED